MFRSTSGIYRAPHIRQLLRYQIVLLALSGGVMIMSTYKSVKVFIREKSNQRELNIIMGVFVHLGIFHQRESLVVVACLCGLISSQHWHRMK